MWIWWNSADFWIAFQRTRVKSLGIPENALFIMQHLHRGRMKKKSEKKHFVKFHVFGVTLYELILIFHFDCLTLYVQNWNFFPFDSEKIVINSNRRDKNGETMNLFLKSFKMSSFLSRSVQIFEISRDPMSFVVHAFAVSILEPCFSLSANKKHSLIPQMSLSHGVVLVLFCRLNYPNGKTCTIVMTTWICDQRSKFLRRMVRPKLGGDGVLKPKKMVRWRPWAFNSKSAIRETISEMGYSLKIKLPVIHHA